MDGTPPPPYVPPSDDDFRIFATNNDRPIFQGDRLRCSDFMRGYATKIANIESLIASLVAVKAARATME